MVRDKDLCVIIFRFHVRHRSFCQISELDAARIRLKRNLREIGLDLWQTRILISPEILGVAEQYALLPQPARHLECTEQPTPVRLLHNWNKVIYGKRWFAVKFTQWLFQIVTKPLIDRRLVFCFLLLLSFSSRRPA